MLDTTDVEIDIRISVKQYVVQSFEIAHPGSKGHESERKGVRLFVKREDQLDQVISGNKFRKLKYNLEEAQKLKKRTLLTFGGAYSNHIHALAYVGKQFDFDTIGIIRGERIEPLNATLKDAEAFGMKLEFVSREMYKHKYSEEFYSSLVENFGDFYLVPEGGSNALAVRGCEEIIDEFEEDYDFICCCAGTGGTAAGIISGLAGKSKVLVFPALKGGDFLKDDIEKLIHTSKAADFVNWQLITDYHFGGYARFTSELIDFINSYKKNFAIPLDPIYTGKMFFGIYDLIKKDYFPQGSRILAIHTGGLQGIRGFNERHGLLLF